jgi:hypothetical protein
MRTAAACHPCPTSAAFQPPTASSSKTKPTEKAMSIYRELSHFLNRYEKL